MTVQALRETYVQVPGTTFSLETAMRLYGLTDFELLWERGKDTKCLVAWDDAARVMVVAFRGTASMSNVLADLQARATPLVHTEHPELWWSVTQHATCCGVAVTTTADGQAKLMWVKHYATGGGRRAQLMLRRRPRQRMFWLVHAGEPAETIVRPVHQLTARRWPSSRLACTARLICGSPSRRVITLKVDHH